MLAAVLANPVVAAGPPANFGPLVPLLSEHAWISVAVIRRRPKTTRAHGRTSHGRPRLPLGGDDFASMVLAP
jgi:hypothetical protein